MRAGNQTAEHRGQCRLGAQHHDRMEASVRPQPVDRHDPVPGVTAQEGAKFLGQRGRGFTTGHGAQDPGLQTEQFAETGTEGEADLRPRWGGHRGIGEAGNERLHGGTGRVWRKVGTNATTIFVCFS